jgi:hypothetical protein
MLSRSRAKEIRFGCKYVVSVLERARHRSELSYKSQARHRLGALRWIVAFVILFAIKLARDASAT